MTDHAPLLSRAECPLCNSIHFLPVLVVDRVIIAKCSECEFIFPTTIPNAAALQDKYNFGYSDDRIKNGQFVNALTNVRLLKRLTGDLRDLRILDVGSGYGFLPSLLNTGCKTHCDGLEISLAQNQYATDRLKVKTFHSLDQISTRYDLICAFEVIEHIPSPLSFVQRLVNLLSPGGHLVIGTDNFQSTTVLQMGAAFPKWIPDEHISCFSPASMDYLLRCIPSLQAIRMMTYEPWEMLVFRASHRVKSMTGSASDYGLSVNPTSVDGHTGSYRFFTLRKLLNPHWAPLNLSTSRHGEMIVSHSRRIP